MNAILGVENAARVYRMGLQKAKRRCSAKTLDDWQDYFDNLYGTQNKDREPSYFVENLVQDIGKVSKYLRLKKNSEVKAGVCSILAWLFALCNAFSSSEAEGKYRLSRLLASKYDPVCPKCRKTPCRCRAPLSSVFVSWSDGVSNATAPDRLKRGCELSR